jgi:electron transfer flavoprotein alpha subunit
MNEKRDRQEWTHLLGVIDLEAGSLSPASKELLGKGRELADQLGVWLMAYSLSPLSGQENQLISHGADVVLTTPLRPSTDEISFSSRQLTKQAESISKVIEHERPEIVLFTSSPLAIALAARVAQHFKTGLATDCTSLSLDLAERKLLATSPIQDGKLFEEYHWPITRPQMASLRAGLFPEAFPDAYREGKIKTVESS